jgi:hypothetical protein
MNLSRLSTVSVMASGLLVLLASSCGGSSKDQEPGASSGGSSGSGGDRGGGTNPGGGTVSGTSGTASGTGGSVSGGGGSAAQGGSDETLAGAGGQDAEPGPVGQVATLGDPCDTPADLACAGNHQKVTLICGGEWVVNETCGSGEYCNSTPGPDVGLCAPEIEECAGLEPGTRFCSAGELLECGPDNMTTPLVESCELGCYAAHCAEPGYEPDPCPDPPAWRNCTDDCGGPVDCTSYECTANAAVPGAGAPWTDGETSATMYRIQVSGEPCPCADGEVSARYAFHPPSGPEGHITVPDPWHLIFIEGEYSAEIPACEGGVQCASSSGAAYYQIYTNDPNAPPINIVVEPGPCP